MTTALPAGGLDAYRSASQRARVATEAWGRRELYCPACASPTLEGAAANRPGSDLVCTACKAAYEMKALSREFGERVLDSGYEAMLASLRQQRRPHLLLLQYRRAEWSVRSLEIVPGFALTPAMIVQRRPLAASARRAGWVGCHIDLRAIPADARIPIVCEGQPFPAAQVRQRFARIRGLAGRSLTGRGWTLEVLRAVRNLRRIEFTLADAYGAERELAILYPANRHPREKIRQQLQVLRDMGIIEFLGRGRYRISPA